MLEAIGLAIIGKTLNRIAGNLLEKLGQKATDNLVELVCEKLTLFNQEGKNNPDDLTRILKEIPELQNITNYDMSTAFNATFGDMSNSLVANQSPNSNLFKDCVVNFITQRQEEMGSSMQETLSSMGKTTNDINNLPALLSSVDKATRECYDYEDKKDLLKNLIKERIEKSVNDDFLEIRDCDTAIEIIAKLTKDELNLLGLCRVAMIVNFNQTIKVIKDYNLSELQIEKIIIHLYVENIKQCLPINTIDKTSITTIFAQYGLNITVEYSKPIFVYKGKSMLDPILADPSMGFLKEHLDIFKLYLQALNNHRVFQKIADSYSSEIHRDITIEMDEILKEETK